MPDDLWYVRSKGRTIGPFPFSKLETLRDRSMLSRFDDVSNDGKTWTVASQVPALFDEPKDQPLTGNQTSQKMIDQDETLFNKAMATHLDRNDPDRSVQWYYVKDGVHVGPISFNDLQVLAARGELVDQSLVWNENLPSWIHASTLPGIVFPRTVKNANETNTAPFPFQIEYVDRSAKNAEDKISRDGGPMTPRLSGFAVSGFVLGLVAMILCVSIYSIIVGTKTRFIAFNYYVTIFALPVITIVSIICGILSTIFSSIALSAVERHGKTLKGKDMAICGLVLGISVLCFMLFLCWLPGYIESMIEK